MLGWWGGAEPPCLPLFVFHRRAVRSRWLLPGEEEENEEEEGENRPVFNANERSPPKRACLPPPPQMPTLNRPPLTLPPPSLPRCLALDTSARKHAGLPGCLGTAWDTFI